MSCCCNKNVFIGSTNVGPAYCDLHPPVKSNKLLTPPEGWKFDERGCLIPKTQMDNVYFDVARKMIQKLIDIGLDLHGGELIDDEINQLIISACQNKCKEFQLDILNEFEQFIDPNKLIYAANISEDMIQLLIEHFYEAIDVKELMEKCKHGAAVSNIVRQVYRSGKYRG